ncbi:nuclear transport factor 2 family protein [Amycolatopsis sp. NPDC059657]|uniref:nuclear transport factor 2 family protein n=1 Tax=Amycolatopsis sp. NPDC059657 TaxID=3346899 RepID=UPI00366C6EDE
MPNSDVVEEWIEKYVHAWTTSARKDIEALFTGGAEYHERPYETDWIGRNEIVEGWQSRDEWQKNGWTFEWEILMITGDTAAVRGRGTYAEFGAFDNLWTLTFAPNGRVDTFRMWNNAAGA